MNKSYISVWNDASGTWVAAPETAKARCGGGAASSRAISPGRDAAARPGTPLKAAFMPIAMAIGVAMLPGTAAAQATTGKGGLELCPGGVGGVGSSWGPLSSSVGFMDCNGAGGSGGMSFSLNNSADDSGANGYNSGNITARVTGFDDGRLELKGVGGITMLNEVDLSSHKITGVAAGNVSSTSMDAVNGAQLYQRTRYFQANSPSSDRYTDAQAKGASSVASGPSAMAIGNRSSAYGANAVAIADNTVALGAGSVASRDDTVSIGFLSADGKSQYTRQITNVTAGAAGTDAVNVDQMNAAIASVSGGGGGGVADNAVTYDNSASNLITLKGATGTKITNLTAGDISSEWSTDAVNGSQLYQTNQNVTNVVNNVANISGNLANVTNVVNNIVSNGIAGSPLVVTYDTSARDTVTLGGVDHTNAVKLTNVAPGDISSASSTDAVNGGQLYTTNRNLNALADNVGGIGVSIYNRGVKYFHANSTLADSSAVGTDSVAIGGVSIATANNSVALGSNSMADRENTVSVGAAGSERQITNVLSGKQDTDAVNLGQMNTALANISGGGSPDAVIYDTSAHDKLTLGGTGATAAVGLTNVAAGQITSNSTDAVNGSQLYNTANSVALALGGSSSVSPSGMVTLPSYELSGKTYADVGAALAGVDAAIARVDGTVSTINNTITDTTKYIKVVSGSSGAIATAGETVAIGGGAYAGATGALAFGAGARSQFANSVAIGSNSSTTGVNTVSVGSKGFERRIENVANGVAPSDVVTLAQLTAMQNTLTQQVSQPSIGVKSMLLAAVPVTSYISVSSNVTQGTTTSTDNALDAMAIGPTATALGEGSLAVGAGAGTGFAGSTAVGTGAAALALNATVIGSGATTSNDGTNGVAIGYMSKSQGADALALGSSSQTNASNSVAMGSNAFVATVATNSMALGSNSSASQANSVALGANSSADRPNTISVGSSTAQRQVVNVKAGTVAADAVNVGQLSGVLTALGGGAAVNGTDGSITKPSYAIGGKTYTDVASALAAIATGESPNGVQYDTSSHSKVTLGGVGSTTPVTLANVADGKANNDAVNVQQLKEMGANIDSSGNVTGAFVAYDDTSKNTITLRGVSGSTKITGLTAGTLSAASTDAVNGAQLYQTNQNVAGVAGNVTNLANIVNNITNGGTGVKYFHVNSTSADSSATGSDAMAIGGNAKATASNSVALGANSLASRANTVDVGSRQITDVAAGTQSTDAVNLAQLQAVGANVDSSGNITNTFVSYDDTMKNTITLKGASGSTKITGLTAGTLSATSTDAINGTQLYATNQNVMNVTNTVNNITSGGGVKYFHANSTQADSSATGTDAVAIGGNAKATANNSVALGANSATVSNLSAAAYLATSGTLSGTTPAGEVSVGSVGNERRLTNVAAGAAATDAVNVSQLQAAVTAVSGTALANAVQYDTSSHSKVTLGGAGSTTPVTLANVAAGKANNDAVNVQQLKGIGANIDSSGNVTGAFVAYDDTSKNTITLRGVSGSTKITGLTAGTLSAASTDAVNGAQLYQTNQNVANVAGNVTNVANIVNNITNGGTGVKYFHANSTQADSSATGTDAVAIGGNAKATANNSVALGANSATVSNLSAAAYLATSGTLSGTTPAGEVSAGSVGNERRLTNVAAGAAATDAVNVSQLQTAVTAVSGTALANAVQYDSATHNKVTLGGAGSTTPPAVLLTNLANGAVTSTSSDAVNGSQLYSTANSVALALGGSSSVSPSGTVTLPSYELGGKTYTDVGSALAGVDGAVTTINNTISDATKYIKVVSTSSAALAFGAESVAIGGGASAIAKNSLALGVGARSQFADSVAIGANSATTVANTISVGSRGAERRIMNVADGVTDTDAATFGQLKALQTSVSQQLAQPSSGVKSMLLAAVPVTNYISVSSNVTQGTTTSTDNALDAMAIGPTATALGEGSLAVGAGAGTGFAGSTAVGTGAGALASNATVIGFGATTSNDGTNGVAIGYMSKSQGADALALGSSSQTNASNSVAMGSNAFVATVATNSMALGSNSSASQANSVALGANSSADRPNTISVGSSTAQRQVVNMQAGTVATDAVNVGQLSGVLEALGGSAAVNGTDGSITKPSYAIGGKTYTDVASALAAVAGGGSPDGVQYDTSSHSKVTLGGIGSTTPVTLTNVAAGQVTSGSKDAINGSQLYGTANSVAAALGGGATVGADGKVSAALSLDGKTYGNVATALDALNAKIATGTTDGVVYDSVAHDTLTLGGANSTTPVQLKNVKNATDLLDAVNFGQMQAYVANHASSGTANGVAYDDSAMNTVTLGGAGHDPVTLTNVATGSNATDAVNFSQFSSLQSQVNNLAGGGAGNTTYVNIGTPSADGTAAAATGSDAIAIGSGAVASGTAAIAIGKDTTTAGDNSVSLGAGASAPNTNSVALGANSTTDRKDSVSVGSTGAERQITNVAAGTQGTDAVNLNQLNNAMGGVQQQMHDIDRSAAKGIASASALNIVTPYLPGRTTLNAGVANYRGYQAVGLGVSRWNEKGTINYNLGVSSSGGNSTIVRAGIGIVLGN